MFGGTHACLLFPHFGVGGCPICPQLSPVAFEPASPEVRQSGSPEVQVLDETIKKLMSGQDHVTPQALPSTGVPGSLDFALVILLGGSQPSGSLAF